MTQTHGSRINAPNEIKKVIPIGMGGEIEILDFTAVSHLACPRAEQEGFAGSRGLEPAAGGIGMGVADEKNRLLLVADHAGCQVMRRRALAHHAGGDDKDSAAA